MIPHELQSHNRAAEFSARRGDCKSDVAGRGNRYPCGCDCPESRLGVPHVRPVSPGERGSACGTLRVSAFSAPLR